MLKQVPNTRSALITYRYSDSTKIVFGSTLTPHFPKSQK